MKGERHRDKETEGEEDREGEKEGGRGRERERKILWKRWGKERKERKQRYQQNFEKSLGIKISKILINLKLHETLDRL